MLMQQGRAIEVAADAGTFTGNRGLEMEEGLIFEIGRPENTGVDLDEPLPFKHRLGSLERQEPAGLPGLSEPEAVRHYVRLSRLNFAIDAGIYPLGSCTMKHNPRLNEAMARLPGFADIHPLQPQSTVQGALELIAELARWLMVMTGMDAVAMPPRAGAHGEACGMMAIKAAIAAKGEGETRKIVLVPESAHGTNPASAVGAGFEVRPVPARPDGTLDPAKVKNRLGADVAAIMLTNPNTCGLFEKDAAEIAALVHEAGAYFYCDGANFNAIMGKARPGDLGMAAGDPALARSSYHRGFRLSRRCLSCAGRRAAFVSSSMLARRPAHLAGSRPSMARWGCSCAPWPICYRMAPMACGRPPRMPC
jgi:glycine dehydrogenase subunit 2